MSYPYNISNILFKNITNPGDGGVINCVIDTQLLVSECLFHYCCSMTNGGSIFKDSGTLKVTKSLFQYVHCSRKSNNEAGNVFDTRNCKVITDYSSIVFCWINSETGDSPIHANNCTSDYKYINGSKNIEVRYGACMFECLSGEACTLSYMNACDSINSRLHYGACTESYLSYTNFINNTVNRYIDSTTLVSNCCFFSNKGLMDPNGATVTYSNCKGDLSSAGISSVASTSIPISFYRFRIPSCRLTYKVNCLRCKSSNYFFFVVLMITYIK